jgi:hypothetical protein
MFLGKLWRRMKPKSFFPLSTADFGMGYFSKKTAKKPIAEVFSN